MLPEPKWLKTYPTKKNET